MATGSKEPSIRLSISRAYSHNLLTHGLRYQSSFNYSPAPVTYSRWSFVPTVSRGHGKDPSHSLLRSAFSSSSCILRVSLCSLVPSLSGLVHFVLSSRSGPDRKQSERDGAEGRNGSNERRSVHETRTVQQRLRGRKRPYRSCSRGSLHVLTVSFVTHSLLSLQL